MEDLKRNDVVQRSEGGPKMSIEKISTTAENVTATCIWIDQKGDKKQQDFSCSRTQADRAIALATGTILFNAVFCA
jgi:uncharacterized protein YodC (DUF2158 family)